MATTYDNASLVMIPSGVKEDKLYSIKPTDGSGDFTFSRGTDTATRVNASGLIEKERANLTLYSEDYTNGYWTKGYIDISANSIANPVNGAITATTFTPNTDIQSHYIRSSALGMSANAPISQSIYAKANGYNYIMLEGYDGAHNPKIIFNLSDGSFSIVSATGSPIGSVEILANGWYRLKMTWQTQSGSPNVYQYYFVYENDTPASYAGNGTSGAYLFGAQLEYGLVATDYIATTSSAVYEGITDNLPRLDYSGGASCPSLLLEPSRTNLFTQSEYFNSADWTKTAINVTDNAVTSPEGIANAAKLVETTANSVHQINQSHSLSGNDYSFSVFVKKAERRYVSLVFSDQARYLSQYTFDLEDGVLTDSFDYGGVTSTFVPEDYGNGWYRLTLSSSYASWSGSVIPRFYIENTATPSQPPANNYVGDGTSGIYIYGVQLEAGIYPTSYIPTYGTAASRAGDVCSKLSVSDLIGQTEGTIYAELDWKGQTGAENMAIWMRSGATSYNEMIALFIGNNFKAQASVRSSSIQQVLLASDTLSDGIIKMAFAYKANDFAFYVNGVLVGTDTNGSVPTCDQIYLGGYPDGGARRGNNKQTLLFKTRLTNAELAALTTI